MEKYNPNIVVIEVNSSVPPGILQRHGYIRQGNSFTATLGVAKQKSYTLVCHTGNLVFVNSALVGKLKMHPRFIHFPDLLFNDACL